MTLSSVGLEALVPEMGVLLLGDNKHFIELEALDFCLATLAF